MNIMFNNLNKKDVEILQWTDIWKKILETLSMQPYISFICLKSFYMYVYASFKVWQIKTGFEHRTFC